MSKFSDGSASSYVELPVPASFLSWTRGNAKLAALKETDPALYFGGWRAFLKGREDVALPAIPIPVINRVSEDGKHPYQVYATNVLTFLPLQHRTRFELRQKTINPDTGREYDKVIAISRKRLEGYIPYRQIFGLVYSPDLERHAPGVIKLFNWSSFISFEKAGQEWNRAEKACVSDEEHVLVRRYGSVGNKDGSVRFEKWGQGYSTPIDPVGIGNPLVLQISNEMNDLFDRSIAWKNCERWNAEGEVSDEPEGSVRAELLKMCNELKFTDDEIEQLLKENGGNYAKALASLKGDGASEAEINAALSESDVLNQFS